MPVQASFVASYLNIRLQEVLAKQKFNIYKGKWVSPHILSCAGFELTYPTLKFNNGSFGI